MSAINGRFDNYKLDTKFGDGYFTHFQRNPGDVASEETWRNDQELGQGASGIVWRQKKDRENVFRAVKRVPKKNIKWNERELLALTKLQRYPEYFVQFFGWFEDESGQNIYFAMEYIQHGDLNRYIYDHEMPVPESDVKTITTQILRGLSIMHSEKISHRDLKPQNILVVSRSPYPIVVKITDFGVSKQAGENTELRTQVGTWSYMAPEILGLCSEETSVYTSAVDIWSLGCLVHTIMTKELPFPQVRRVDDYFKNGIFPNEKLLERHASQDAIKFITKIMKPNPGDRLSAKGALKDRWLSTNTKESRTADSSEAFFGNVSWGASSWPSLYSTKSEEVSSRETVPSPQIVEHTCHTPYCAIQDKDWAALKRLCQDSRVNVNTRAGKNGNIILLHMVAQSGNEEILELLLQKGASVNATDGKQRTALHWVAERGDWGMTRLLLERGANKELGDINGFTALHLAARNGRDDILELLLEGEVETMVASKNENIALKLAIEEGHGGVVKLLLERLSLKEEFIQSEFGKVSLHLAAQGGHEDVMRVLLESGVDIMTKDESGFPVLHTAVKKRHESLVKQLLDKGAEIETRDLNGYTALHLAASDGCEGLVGLLLDKQANISAQHKDGYTALHLAARKGHCKVVELLLRNGADVDVKDIHGDTPLQKAISRGHKEAVVVLLRQRADVSIQYTQNFTALHLAADKGHDEIVALLLEQGNISINKKDDHAFTALHLAVSGGHEGTVKVLLDKGADILAKHVAGSTALHIAAREGYEGIVKLLLDKMTAIKADIDEKDQQGKTAYQIAKSKGHDKVARLISASRPSQGIIKRLSKRVRSL